MLYKLSKAIPMRMSSTYGADGGRIKSTWWQWRDHIWRHKSKRVD